MRAISDAFFQIETLSICLAAIAVLAGVFILLSSFLRAFRGQIRGLKPASGRLGLVESFALDRQRQLLAVRRDEIANHLIMIGGRSDLVIETHFTTSGGSVEIDDIWPDEEAKEMGYFNRIRSYVQPASRIFVGPGLVPLAVLSGIAGAGAGLICGFFRLALAAADRFRISLPTVWHGEPLLGCGFLIAGAAAAAALRRASCAPLQ